MYHTYDLKETKDYIEMSKNEGAAPIPVIDLRGGCREVIVNDMVKDLYAVEKEIQIMAYGYAMQGLIEYLEARTFEDTDDCFDNFVLSFGWPEWANDLKAFSRKELSDEELTKEIVFVADKAWKTYRYIRNLGK